MFQTVKYLLACSFMTQNMSIFICTHTHTHTHTQRLTDDGECAVHTTYATKGIDNF